MLKEEDMFTEYQDITEELKKSESDYGYLLKKIYGEESMNQLLLGIEKQKD